MPELHDPTREELSETVSDLVKRHGGPSAVARIVSVDRTRVHAWMKGDIGIDRLGQLAEKLEEPVVVRFGPAAQTKEDAAPPWARRLSARILWQIRRNRQVVRTALMQGIEEELAQYGFRKARDEQSDDESSLGSEDQQPTGVVRP